MSLGKKEPAKDQSKAPSGGLKNPFKPGTKEYALWEFRNNKGKEEEKKKEEPKKRKEESKSSSPDHSVAHHLNITKKAKGRVNRSGRMHAKFAKHAMNLHRGKGGDLPHHEELTFAEMFTQKFKNKLS